MAWEWSHTAEAYSNANNNLYLKDRSWIVECYGEWHALETDDDGELDYNSFDQEAYSAAVEEAADMTIDELIDYIWNRMSEHATCDNGGFNAYCCPSGCHTVPFDPLDG